MTIVFLLLQVGARAFRVPWLGSMVLLLMCWNMFHVVSAASITACTCTGGSSNLCTYGSGGPSGTCSFSGSQTWACPFGFTLDCSRASGCPCGYSDPCNIRPSFFAPAFTIGGSQGNYQSIYQSCNTGFQPVFVGSGPNLNFYTAVSAQFTVALRPTLTSQATASDVATFGPTSCIAFTSPIYQTSGSTIYNSLYMIIAASSVYTSSLINVYRDSSFTLTCIPQGTTACRVDSDCPNYASSTFPLYCNNRYFCSSCVSCLQNDDWMGSDATHACPPQCGNIAWDYSGWSSCTKQCGNGTRTRSLSCLGKMPLGANPWCCGMLSGTSWCRQAGPRPVTVDSCNERSCYSWSQGPWSPCSVTCGGGIQTRTPICVDYNGNTVSNALCSGLSNSSLGPSAQSCNTDPIYLCYNWFPQQPGLCSSTTCGLRGTQNREVLCGSTTAAAPTTAVSYVSAGLCNYATRPSYTIDCDPPCPTAESSSSSSAAGAVAAGGAVGGVAVIALVALLVIFLIRRRRARGVLQQKNKLKTPLQGPDSESPDSDAVGGAGEHMQAGSSANSPAIHGEVLYHNPLAGMPEFTESADPTNEMIAVEAWPPAAAVSHMPEYDDIDDSIPATEDAVVSNAPTRHTPQPRAAPVAAPRPRKSETRPLRPAPRPPGQTNASAAAAAATVLAAGEDLKADSVC